jgi:hypothetical protein
MISYGVCTQHWNICKQSTCFFFQIVAINIFKVKNFHLLIEISPAKYVILRKQMFNKKKLRDSYGIYVNYL